MPKQLVENTFDRFTRDALISVILVTQEVSEKYLREKIARREEIYPVILEIPSKEKPYDPVKDLVMQRAHRLLYGSDLAPESLQ
jgi:V-type H+-transporting ATPase subunit F